MSARDADKEPKGNIMELNKYQKAENIIIRKAVRAFIGAGFTVSVFDGEEYSARRSRKVEDVMRSLRATDADRLIVRDNDGERVGSVLLVYGNEPYEVIADYSLSLNDLLRDAEARAAKMEMDMI